MLRRRILRVMRANRVGGGEGDDNEGGGGEGRGGGGEQTDE